MANWRERQDAARVQAEFIKEAERVGLDGSAVLDRLNVSGAGAISSWYAAPDALIAEIRAEARRLALEHPEHVRDPSALKLSPAEVHGRVTQLLAEGRKREAEELARRFPTEYADGRTAAVREAKAREEAERRARLREIGVRNKLLEARRVLDQEEKNVRDIVERGVRPGSPNGPAMPATLADRANYEQRLTEAQARVLILKQELAAMGLTP